MIVPAAEPVIVPVREPVIVPAAEPVIVPVREPVIVPTLAVLEPVIVPPNETEDKVRVRTVTAKIDWARFIVILLVDLIVYWGREDGDS